MKNGGPVIGLAVFLFSRLDSAPDVDDEGTGRHRFAAGAAFDLLPDGRVEFGEERVGLGFELDSSKYDIFITRTRLVARYMLSNSTSGYSIGLAMSF